MFYLEEKNVYDFRAENNLEFSVPTIKDKVDSESDDFKYEIGDTVYRVTETLQFRKFKIKNRYIGSTSSYPTVSRIKKKCYEVTDASLRNSFNMQKHFQKQYEDALFETKEAAFLARSKQEKAKVAGYTKTLRLQRFEKLCRYHLGFSLT